MEGRKEDSDNILKELNAVVGSTSSSPSAGDRLADQQQHRQHQQAALQTVFSVVDHLNKWLRSKQQVGSAGELHLSDIKFLPHQTCSTGIEIG